MPQNSYILGNKVDEGDWFNKVLETTQEDIEIIKNEIPTLDIAQQYDADIQSFNAELDYKQRQEEASFSEKALGFSMLWDSGTIVGSLLRRLDIDTSGIGSIDSDDYDFNEDWKNNIPDELVIDTAKRLGLNPKQMTELYQTKSPEHFRDLINFFDNYKRKEAYAKSVLTEGEQTFANLATIFDVDTAVSFGIPVAGVRNVLKVGKTGTTLSAVASGAIASSKPYIVDNVNHLGQDSTDIFIDSALAGFLEFGATKYLTPEIQKSVGETLGRTKFNLKNSYVKDVSINQTFTWKTTEDFIDIPDNLQKPLQDIAKGYTEVSDEIYKIVDNITLKSATKEEALAKLDNLRINKEDEELSQYVNKVKKGLEDGLIKPLNENSKEILSTKEKAKADIDNIPDKPQTEAEKVMREVETFNAREISLKNKGKTSNQLTKYFREIRERLTGLQKSNKELLSKDKEYLQHLTNQDYESALLRAEEIVGGEYRPKILEEKPKDFTTKEQAFTKPTTLEEAIDLELREATQQVLNKTKLFSQAKAFSHASDDIRGMFDKLAENIKLADINPFEAKKSLEIVKKDVGILIDELKKIDGIDNKLIEKLSKEFYTALGSTTKEVVTNNPTVQRKLISNTIKAIKKDINLLKKYSGEAYEEVSKLGKKIKDISKKLEEQRLIASRYKINVKPKKQALAKIQELEKQLKNTKFEYEKTLNNATKQIEEKLVEDTMNGVKLERVGRNFRVGGKLIPAGIVLGLLGSSAFASSDDTAGDLLVSGFKDLVIVGLLLAVGYSAIKGGLNKTRVLKVAKQRLEKATEHAEAIEKQATTMQKVSNTLKSNYEAVRGMATETFEPLKSYAKISNNEKLMKFVDDMLVDPLNGKSMVGENIKFAVLREFQHSYTELEEKLYSSWLEKQNLTFKQKIIERVTGIRREEFRKLVTAYKDKAIKLAEGGGSEFIEEMANGSRKLMEDILNKYGKELELEGYSQSKMIDNYAKRMYKQDGLQALSQMLNTAETRPMVIDMFKKMYLSAIGGLTGSFKVAYKNLDKDLQGLKTISEVRELANKFRETAGGILEEDGELMELLRGISKTENINEAIQKYIELVEKGTRLGSDEVAIEKITKYLEDITSFDANFSVADIFGSFKRRVPLDLTKLEGITANINGVQKELSLETLFERNDYTLSNIYINQLSGRIGLKAKGYSVEQAKEIIDSVKNNPRIHKLANDSLKAMLGQPLFTADEGVLKTMQTVSNISYATSLPLVGFSFLTEVGYILGRSIINPKEGLLVLNNMVDIIKGHGKDSALVEALKNAGLGTNMHTGNLGSRIDIENKLSGIIIDETDLPNTISKIARDFVFKYSGLLKLSDILELSNGVANMQRLHDVANGIKKLDKAIMQKYGLTEKDFEIARKYLKTNKQGYVKKVDTSSMTLEEEMRFKSLLETMGQLGSQRHTIGGTPNWTRDNILGASVSKLLMYTIQSYSNLGLHQIRGTLGHGSIETSVQVAFGFMGGYIGLKLRDEIRGVKRSEEDYYTYSLLGLPMFAPYSAMKGLSNPVVFKTTQDIIGGGY